MRASLDASFREHRRGVERRALIRRLRGQATDAEQALWRLLRHRQLVGAKFRRQHEFGPYVLDFYCPEHLLVVEADGGHHFDPEQRRADADRTQYLLERGLRVLRFSNADILRTPESVLAGLLEALGTPSPWPSPRGRGDAGNATRPMR